MNSFLQTELDSWNREGEEEDWIERKRCGREDDDVVKYRQNGDWIVDTPPGLDRMGQIFWTVFLLFSEDEKKKMYVTGKFRLNGTEKRFGISTSYVRASRVMQVREMDYSVVG